MIKTLHAFLLSGLTALTACNEHSEQKVPASNPIAPETQRELTTGAVVGFYDGEKTLAWLGIHYAKAPVGELRWRAPQAPERWSGVREAVHFQNICPQLGGIASDVPKAQYGKVVGSEDCLFLNVWAPRSATTTTATTANHAPLPVMLWIHGGGNSIGTANTYSYARELAGNQQVVVVTINYRLGLFGWFSHPALADAASDQSERSGNFGTLDIIQSLRWVRDNIAAFGGDPNNVTIFGESAGGFNTYSLMLSPDATGLFHKAISQSGGIRLTPIAEAQNFTDETPAGHTASSKELLLAMIEADGLASNREQAKTYLAGLNDTKIASYLRGKSTEQLFKAVQTDAARFGSMGMLNVPTVFQDGFVIPQATPQEILETGAFTNRVPLITGTNRDELKTFQSGDPRFVKSWFGLIPQIRDSQDYDRSAHYGSELWRIMGANLPATTLTRVAAEPPVFVYRFDFDQLKENWLVSLPKLLGAGHGLEIQFAFGANDVQMSGTSINSDDTLAARAHLAHAMSSYWANFAYTGNPGRGRAGDLPEWQAWNNADDGAKTLLLDADNRGGIRQTHDTLSLADLKQQLRSDASLQKDQAALCRTYLTLFHRGFSGRSLFDADEFATLGDGSCKIKSEN